MCMPVVKSLRKNFALWGTERIQASRGQRVMLHDEISYGNSYLTRTYFWRVGRVRYTLQEKGKLQNFACTSNTSDPEGHLSIHS